MPAFSIDRDQAVREIAAVERALEEGHPPPGVLPIGATALKGALRVAVERLQLGSDQSLRRRIGTPQSPGSIFRRFQLAVDWAKYKPRPEPEPEPEPAPAVPAEPPGPPADPIELRRLRDRLDQSERALKEAERRAVEAEARERDILGLTQEPLRPQLALPKPGETVKGGRTVILHLSDVHYGETVLAEEMDGLNRYDSDVAKARLGRFFARASDLMTKHWKGEPPDEIVLCLGGDLISGNLHPELEQTNFPTVPETVREVGEHIAGGIIMLRNEVKRPIRVYSVPGNHGRTTPKPQSKARSASSLDLLAADFAEAMTRGAKLKDVAFYKAQSPDCYFSTYGWHWLLTHGDSVGGRGAGTGFIGPMATIIKGHRKLVDTSWRAGKPVHAVLTGHFHTTGRTYFGWANGSVIGYSDYARDLRADAEPATAEFHCRAPAPRRHQPHGIAARYPRRRLALCRPGDGGAADLGRGMSRVDGNVIGKTLRWSLRVNETKT